jgi:hypothetical protein
MCIALVCCDRQGVLVETDRHAPDGDDRSGGTAATSPDDAADPSPSAARPGADQPASGTDPAHSYGYGDAPLEAAGIGGPRAADSGAADAEASSADPATGLRTAAGDAPATDVRSATGLRGGTAPRAVLRPIPEGFPTPPPRPARPNRRPAPKPDPSAAPRRPRGLLLAGISAAAVLLLVVVVGGGILAIRALTPEAPVAVDPVAQESEAPAAPDSPGQVRIGEVELTEVSTEVGVRSVGGQGSGLEPEGEYVIVTFEVMNPTDAGATIGQNLALETADGAHPVDPGATQAHLADSSAYGTVPPGGTGRFHAVFDVPIGSDPTGLQVAISTVGQSGTLPLSG